MPALRSVLDACCTYVWTMLKWSVPRRAAAVELWHADTREMQQRRDLLLTRTPMNIQKVQKTEAQSWI